jgi:hypothetical protein
MDTVGQQKLWSFSGKSENAEVMECTAIRKSDGLEVHSFLELARKVAELQFLNRDLVLMFRGQPKDYKNQKKNTSLKPTIFRFGKDGKLPSQSILRKRFEKLSMAEFELVERYQQFEGTGRKQKHSVTRLQRQRILRWSILQHYEVCDTPLLDVTHSLRIAASFASQRSEEYSYLMVVGVPNLSGAITASADAGLQIIRLSSVCPPSAIRPHIQEGYLLGEYPEIAESSQKEHYFHYEIDFGRRLVAKFKFRPDSFWRASEDFPQLPEAALYPPDDPLKEMADQIRLTVEGYT